MTAYTIETAYLIPFYRQRTYEADTIEQACAFAVADEGWSDEEADVDSSGDTYVSGVWLGQGAAYHGPAQTIPAHFRETIERKAEHFDALLALLKEPAQVMGLSAADFDNWLRRATPAIARAQAIIAGEPDPG